jgi:hypothetical protein
MTPQGLPHKYVKVEQITERSTALCIDVGGAVEIEVPLLPQRAKGGLPQVGEVWLIDRTFGTWNFAAIWQSVTGYNSGISILDALPTPEEGQRGREVLILGDPGVADVLYVCLKSAADTYSWKQVQAG